MYEDFYGLSEKPFSILPDPDYIYWGRGHRLAYTMLEYGIINWAGFTVITGEIGCGKTTLMRLLLRNLDDDLTVGLVANTQDVEGDFLSWVMLAFGLPYEGSSRVSLHDQFQKFLLKEYRKGSSVLLIVDEAQNLGPKTLEELRMLSNINADKDQILQVILLGQPQLRDLLRRPDLVQFAQRIASDYHIRPLDAHDTAEYINHRLKLAGGKESLFSKGAMGRIYQSSGGIPRVINILCDTALVYGFSNDQKRISESTIREVIKDKSDYGIFSNGSDHSQVPQQSSSLNKDSGGEEKGVVRPFRRFRVKSLF